MTQGARAVEQLLRRPGSKRAQVEPLLSRWWGGEPVYAVGVAPGKLADMLLLLETHGRDYLVVETAGQPAAVLSDRPFPAGASAFTRDGVEPGPIDGQGAVGLVLMRLDQGGKPTLSERWAAVKDGR